MFRKVLYLGIAFVLLLFSCKQELKQESENFEEYLKTNFGQTYKNDLHYYLLISRFACPACIKKTMFEISQRVNETNNRYFTVLAYDSTIFPIISETGINYLIDPEARYEQLHIPTANVTIILTQDYEIQNIKVVNLNEIDVEVDKVFLSVNSEE